MAYKITESRLRRIILEEIAALEVPEDAGASMSLESERLKLKSNVLNKAAALMKAIESFEEDCPAGCMSSVGSSLDNLKSTLTDMGKNPDAYVDQKPPTTSAFKGHKTELLEPEDVDVDADDEEDVTDLEADADDEENESTDW